MMWLTNDMGFLLTIPVREIDICKGCGHTFKRKAEFTDDRKMHQDTCPYCGTVHHEYVSIRFDNECVDTELAVV